MNWFKKRFAIGEHNEFSKRKILIRGYLKKIEDVIRWNDWDTYPSKALFDKKNNIVVYGIDNIRKYLDKLKEEELTNNE